MINTPPSRIVSLISDFGDRDTYAGQMKAVVLRISPDARVLDLTHNIPRQDVLEGAFQLATAWEVFPPGSVHLVVVDPGVGTPRRPIAFSFRNQYFVMPDNGLATLVLNGQLPDQLVVLNRPDVHREHVSSTFHGRDIFAPIAAYLAAGRSLADIGQLIASDDLVRLDIAPIQRTDDSVVGSVVSIDHFGNCRTLIRADDLGPTYSDATVRCGSAVIRGIVPTFGSVAEGRTLALFGSHGGLEIAVRMGSAARSWDIKRGDLVEVTFAKRS